MDDTSRRVGTSRDVTGRATEDLTDSASGSSGLSGSESSDTDEATETRTAEIRRDIEQTRDEMSETIDAIQEKLRPANIVSSATERVKGAMTERVRQMKHSAENAAGSMMSRTREGGFATEIRENPIPAALIGVGAAWLLMKSRSKSQGGSRYGRAYRDYGAGDAGGRYGDMTGVGEDYEDARSEYASPRYSGDDRPGVGAGLLDRVTSNPVPATLACVGLGWLAFAGRRDDEWYDDAYGDDERSGRRDWRHLGSESSPVSNVSEKVSSAASGVAESARHLTSEAQEYTYEAARRARRVTRRGQNELQRMTRENPLAVGAGALLLGAAVGLAIPETERERELLGETRDAMLDRAQDIARTAASRAQDAAADLAGEAASRIVGGKSE